MCLDTKWGKRKLAAIQKRNAKEPILAWKLVRKLVDGGKVPSYEGPYQRVKFSTGFANLNVETRKQPLGWGKYAYRAGFHVYMNKSDADARASGDGSVAVLPALLWDIVAGGTQEGKEVLVARKMMLLV